MSFAQAPRWSSFEGAAFAVASCLWAGLLVSALGCGWGLWSWGQAHDQVAGLTPGAVATSLPILAVQPIGADEEASGGTQLWVDLPERGVGGVRALGRVNQAWRPGALLPLLRAPGYPEVNAVDPPGPKAKPSEMLLVPMLLAAMVQVAVVASVVLFASLAVVWGSWRSSDRFRDAKGYGWMIWGLLLMLLSAPFAWAAGNMGELGEGTGLSGEMAVVRVLPRLGPWMATETGTIWVQAAPRADALDGPQRLLVGEALRKALGPQHRLNVSVDPHRGQLHFEGSRTAATRMPLFWDSVVRVLWATVLLMLGQALVQMALGLGRCFKRKRRPG